MRNFDLSPLYRSAIGFDRLFNHLENNQSQSNGGYPPYNVELYQGIAERNFERKFQLAENIHVRGANLVNGLLYIDLERVIPEAKKPRRIEIN